jgi:hypothetical protein
MSRPAHRLKRGLRLGGWCLLGLVLLAPWPLEALSTNKPADKIPELRPLRDVMGPSWWEAQAGKVLGGAALSLAVLGGLTWWLRRPKPQVAEPPAVTARRALEILRGRAEEGELGAQVSRALCRYVQVVLRLPLEERTPEELLGALAGGRLARGELVAALAALLKECEARAFAPTPPPTCPGLVERALELATRFAQAAAEREPAGASRADGIGRAGLNAPAPATQGGQPAAAHELTL